MEPSELQLRSHLIKSAEQIGAFIRRRIPADLRSVLSYEDVRQEVWIKAHQKLPAPLLGDDQAVLRWLSVVARRKLMHAAAKAYAKKRGGDFRRVIDDYPQTSCVGFLGRFVDEGCRTPSSEQAVGEASRAVRLALSSLPDDQLRVVCMRYFEGRSRAEIGKRIGKSQPAVNSLLHRGMISLRSSLGDAGRFFSGEFSQEEGATVKGSDKP